MTDASLTSEPEKLLPEGIALEDVTPTIAAAFADNACLIYSGKHRLYWRANAHGYTSEATRAGRYTIGDAYERTRHCDPDKQIRFVRLSSPVSGTDGYVMVPREPTEAMVNAAHLAALIETGVDTPRFVRVQEDHARAVWSAMLAVSSKPKEGVVTDDEVEVAAISLIVDLCGAGASQSATNVRVVEDHLRQFARALSASPSTPIPVIAEAGERETLLSWLREQAEQHDLDFAADVQAGYAGAKPRNRYLDVIGILSANLEAAR